MRTVAIYRPGKAFPSISVTGTSCDLLCDHCQGRFLRGMIAASSPDELMMFARRLEAEGGTGFLLSGGCDRQGRVPLEAYLPAVRGIKESTSLKVNLHPGLVSEEGARDIADSGADRISFDLLMDEWTMKGRMHLDRSPDDNLRSFLSLCRAAPGRVAPHVLLGAGSEERELEAVRVACDQDIPCLILLSLLGERVEDWEGRLLRAVREGVSDGRKVLLGCMRPRGRPDVEMAALEAGAEGIASPSALTVKGIKERGWAWKEHRTCCALHL